MTDPSKQVELDAFLGFHDPFAIGDDATHQAADGSPAPPGHREQVTHFVGDDCAPDGHRSEALMPDPEPEARPKRSRKAAAPAGEKTPTERLVGLIYTSAHDDIPHIVTRHLYEGGLNDVACTCKAGTFNLPTGCWAMNAARAVMGLPAQGSTDADI